MIGIDLYDQATEESKSIALKYCKKLYSSKDGKEFILNELPKIATTYDLETAKIVETDGFSYLDSTIENLQKSEKQINIWLGHAMV